MDAAPRASVPSNLDNGRVRLLRPLIRLDTFGMVNLIAGRRIAPELIQDDCTGERIAGEVLAFLTRPDRLERMRRDLAGVRERLASAGDASLRAADAVLRLLPSPATPDGR